MSDSLHQKIQEIAADRGTIYSDNGQMLSTSIPQFDVYIDFEADGLREKNGKRFTENLDSLSYGLAELFKDKTAAMYKQLLKEGYRKGSRYFSLKKGISYRTYQKLLKLPLVREGRNKSGFIAETKNIRLNPYQILAYRTIGLNRSNSQKVGLEGTYDSVLKGRREKGWSGLSPAVWQYLWTNQQISIPRMVKILLQPLIPIFRKLPKMP
ncbi:penicillin-binding protein 2 [Arachidicoccus ginsenosidivorans]|uniref:hypothetical protein n=1 Tax=Arachidicoccus ginsenosidivorans TaxID=496057 RepID=UPI001CEF5BB2|nr:hypothetical protein [Arachidicoccus ginsenosidivorans]